MVSDGFQYFFWCSVCFLATSSLRLCSWNNLHRVYQVSISSSDLWYYILCFKIYVSLNDLMFLPKPWLCAHHPRRSFATAAPVQRCASSPYNLRSDAKGSSFHIDHMISWDWKLYLKKNFYTPSIYLCNFRHWISLSTVHFPYLLLPP